MYDLDTMIFEDTDRTIQLALKDTAGLPVDISAGAYELRLAELSSATATITKSLTVTGGPAGECECTFTAAETSAMLAGRKKFSIRRTDVGNHRVLQYGLVSVEKVI